MAVSARRTGGWPPPAHLSLLAARTRVPPVARGHGAARARGARHRAAVRCTEGALLPLPRLPAIASWPGNWENVGWRGGGWRGPATLTLHRVTAGAAVSASRSPRCSRHQPSAIRGSAGWSTTPHHSTHPPTPNHAPVMGPNNFMTFDFFSKCPLSLPRAAQERHIGEESWHSLMARAA